MSELNAVITSKIEVAPGLMILQVKPKNWDLPDFKGGQFVVLGVPATVERVELSDKEDIEYEAGKIIKKPYSIASSSLEKEYIEFYITLVRSGSLTPRLFNLKVGDEVFMGKKFTGMFTLEEVPKESNIVLIATGTGLAPYMSMLRSELMCKDNREFAVIHGARHSWDLGYESELATMDRLCDNFKYVSTISRPKEERAPWNGNIGYVQDIWKIGDFENTLGFMPTAKDTHVFLCGTPGMVDEMVVILQEDGYKEHTRKETGNLHYEKWW